MAPARRGFGYASASLGPPVTIVPVRLFAVLLALSLALPIGLGTARAAGAQAPLPTVPLTASFHVITAEFAREDRARTLGLMYRERLQPGHGMLFRFDSKAPHCMWMRNTLIALSVAFLDDDGTIVNIEDMQPQTEDSHCASRPVRFALEMERGWFAQRGLKPGAKIGGLPTR